MNNLIMKRPRGLNLLWGVVGVILVFYAYLAMQAGTHNLPFNTDPKQIELLNEVEALGNKDAPYAEVEDAADKAFPVWNHIMARIAGTYYGYGTNGTTEPLRYYASMLDIEKYVLSTHMLLGGVCIILGIFQFWPAFRKNYRKAHRVTGGVYILATYTMVFASVYHLLHTGVANTYQGFAFYIQLWFLVISTLITQTLAIYFIKKRNFTLHLGFQVYTYVAFLNAPIQRYDWMIFGWIYPHLSQGEVNNLVNIMTFWQSLIVGYLIFAWNRASAPVRPKPVEMAPISQGQSAFFWGLAAIGVLTTIAFYLYSPGLGSWRVSAGIVPATTLQADALLFAGRTLQNIIFTLAICAAIISGVWLLIRNGASALARKIFYVTAVIGGVIQMSWGWQLGEPSIKVISGGGFYFMSGLSLVLFSMLALYFQIRGKDNFWREMMVFAANFAFSPALLLWGHVLWYYLDVIPQQYLDIGHGYILAAGAGMLTPAFNGFFGIFTSRETRSRAIS